MTVHKMHYKFILKKINVLDKMNSMQYNQKIKIIYL